MDHDAEEGNITTKEFMNKKYVNFCSLEFQCSVFYKKNQEVYKKSPL